MEHLLIEDFVNSGHNPFLHYNLKLSYTKSGFIDIRKYKYDIGVMTDEYREIRNKVKKQKQYENDFQTNKRGRTTMEESNSKITRADNLARTRKKVIEYCAANSDKFKSFVTLTFAKNLTDLTEANKAFNIYITRVRKYCMDQGRQFYYLAIPEFQNRGAVHYHMLCSEKVDTELIPNRKPISTYSKNKKKYITITNYDLMYWKHGFSLAIDLTNDDVFDDQFNVAIYMCGYLFKDMDGKLFNRTKILKSNNLDKPDYIYFDDENAYESMMDVINTRPYNINYFECKFEDYNLQFMNEYKSYSLMLHKDDHQYFEDLIKYDSIKIDKGENKWRQLILNSK